MIFAVVLRIVGVPALAFALGMYLPMELNTPVLLGGILSWIVSGSGGGDGDEAAEDAPPSGASSSPPASSPAAR